MFRRRSIFGAAITAACLSLVFGSPACTAELHVALHGNDAGEGTRERPLGTLAAARDRIRHWKKEGKLPPHGVQVVLHAGRYELADTFHLEEIDSGTAEAPIVYRAAPDASVRISGGVCVPSFTPASAADDDRLSSSARLHVQYATVPAELVDLGTPAPRSYFRPMQPAAAELFCGDCRVQLARWPDTGWAHTVDIQEQDQGWQFKVQTATGASCPSVVSTAARAHGFWSEDGVDSQEPVVSPSPGQFVLAERAEVPAIRHRARVRILDALELLDSPGEWYLDRDARRVYYWPASEFATADRSGSRQSSDSAPVELSRLGTLLSLYGVHHVRWEGITVECARAVGIEIAGGSQVAIRSCTIRNTGNVGIHIYGGQGHRVEECEVYNSGDGAVRIEGGDSPGLIPCGHELVNNHLHDFSQSTCAFRSGVVVWGVGVVIRHNLIHDGDHAAVLLHGQDHVVEGNEIHSCCLETTAVGGIQLAGGWADRGNTIRHNHLHDLGRFHRRDVMGVYLDSLASGTVVEGNLICRAGRGVAIGGGRDNRIWNNVFVDCAAGIQIDNRGQTWLRPQVEDAQSEIRQQWLTAVSQSEAFRRRYPAVVHLMDDVPGLASGNEIVRNIVSGPRGIDLHDGLSHREVVVRENLTGIDPRFVDAAAGDFRLQDDSPAWSFGFRPLPFDDMGRRSAPHRLVVDLTP